MTGVWSSVIMRFVNGHSEQMQCPCAPGHARHSPGDDGRAGCGLFHGLREDSADASVSGPAWVKHGGVMLLITVMVRSMLLHLQGHEARSHADLTDRDRDESSRRAIGAWVRTNPQTQVRMRRAARCPRFLLAC